MYHNIEHTLDSLFSWSSTPRIPILIAIYYKPGISFLELKFQCKLSRSTLHYHLDILISEGYLNTTGTGYNLISWVSEFLQACHRLAFAYGLRNQDFLYQINGIKKQHCLILWDYLFQTKTSLCPTLDELVTTLNMKKTSLRKYVVRSIQSQFIAQSKAPKKSLRQLYLTQKGINTFLTLKKYTASI